MKKFSIVLTGLFMGTPALAAPVSQTCTTTNCGTGSFRLLAVIQTVINWILAFAALIAVLFIVWGGIQYILAAGNTDRAKNARQTILYAVVGLIIIVLSYFIVSFVSTLANGFFNTGTINA